MADNGPSRAALLPERLKRKQNVRKREQNENILRTSQPWRPGGSKEQGSSVVGVQPQQRPSLSINRLTAAVRGPLTSTFSVRDSLQSLRSSRVFKQKDADDLPPEPLKQQHIRPPAQPSINKGPAKERPVLQPVLQPVRLSASSKASSCGSNSGLQAPPSHRTSYSSLDSAVNQCISPTDDGQHCIAAGTDSLTQVAESKQQQPQAQQQQQQALPVPARESSSFQLSLRIPQVADSCCELLQLLQMDVSPTCSRVGSGNLDQLPPGPGAASKVPAAAVAVAERAPPATAAPAAAKAPLGKQLTHGLPSRVPAAAGAAVKRAQVRDPTACAPKAHCPQAAAVPVKPRSRVGTAAPWLPSRIPAAAGHGLRRAAGTANKQHGQRQQQNFASVPLPAAVSQPVSLLGALHPQHSADGLIVQRRTCAADKAQQAHTMQPRDSQQQQPQQQQAPALQDGQPSAGPPMQQSAAEADADLSLRQQQLQQVGQVGAQQQPTQQLQQQQPQAQQEQLPEAVEIEEMRKKLFAMQQQLLALQQRPQAQQSAEAVQKPHAMVESQQQQQQQQQRRQQQEQQPSKDLLPPQLQSQQQELSSRGSLAGSCCAQESLHMQNTCPPQQLTGADEAPNSASCSVQLQDASVPAAAQQQPQQQLSVQQAALADQQAGKTAEAAAPAFAKQAESCSQQLGQEHAPLLPPPALPQQQDNVIQQGPVQQQLQPAGRQFGTNLNSAQHHHHHRQQQQQQQSNSYQTLLEGTRTLVANSHWQAALLPRHMGSSPLKNSSSPSRLCSLTRTPGGMLGGSPGFKQLSRLSVSQSWAGASPGPTPRPGFAAAVAAGAHQQHVGASAASWVGEAVKARLFGPALGAVSEALHEPQLPGHSAYAGAAAGAAAAAAAVSKADGSLSAGSVMIEALGQGSHTLPQPVLTACSSPSGSFSRSFGMLPLQGQQSQQQLHVKPSMSPAGLSTSNRALLCTSRVAQVLFGTPSKVPAGLSMSQPHQSAGQAAEQHAGAALSPKGSAQGGVLHASRPAGLQGMQQGAGGACGGMTVTEDCAGQGGGTPGAASCRYEGLSDAGGSGSACQPRTDSDSGDDDDQGYRTQQGPRRPRVQVAGQDSGVDRGTRSMSASQQGQQGMGLTGSYDQQEQQECWTVHTNWAADLDAETAAVAAAAAAAAGLSAQLGRGHAVRLQEHSPFLPGITAEGLMQCAGSRGKGMKQLGLDLAACPPMWVSMACKQPGTPNGAAGTAQEQDEDQQDEQQCPPVCSPICLMVPRKLWNSPGEQ